MNRNRRTQGAALILTVLIVMILLAAILFVTSQLALQARRSSTEQDAVVQSQYVAESGLARAQARMNLINNILTNDYFVIPTTVTTSAMLADVMNLCNISSAPTTAYPQVLCSSTDQNYGLLGSTPASTLSSSSNNRLNLFVNYLTSSDFSANNYTLGTNTSGETIRSFWANSLRGLASVTDTDTLGAGSASSGNGQFTSTYGVTLLKVRRTATDSYELTFGVPDVNSQGQSSNGLSSRNYTAEAVSSTYVLSFGRDSFAKYALFTNHHFISSSAEKSGSAIVFTSNTLFSGPVHTNQKFRFTGTPYFGGHVSSAGCPQGAISSDGQTCSSSVSPGAYLNTTLYAPAKMTPTDQAPVDGTGSGKTNPQFLKGVDWNPGFVPMPNNDNSQTASAQNGGLYIPSDVTSMNLSTGSITPSGGSATAVQYITYAQTTTTAGKSSTTTTNLATDATGAMYIKVNGVWVGASQIGTKTSSAQWVATSAVPTGTIANTTFNGVIYSNGAVSSLTGPARTNRSDPSTAAPAVAAFAQLTLAASGDVHIKSDLKYESPPCSGSNSVSNGTFVAATCNNTSTTNILGIYSSGGNIDIDSPSKYGTAAGVPPNVNIHAVLMANGANGSVTVDGYDSGSSSDGLGVVNLQGGLIENYYGAFGITDGHGFGRNFVYDPRTADGVLPPSFPTQQSWSITTFSMKLSNVQSQRVPQ